MGQRRNDVFPSVALAKSDIWDESVRLGIAKPKYTKKELDDRRAKVSGHSQRLAIFINGSWNVRISYRERLLTLKDKMTGYPYSLYSAR